MREKKLDDYVDGAAAQVSNNDPLLVIGEMYNFRVRIRIAFGSSEFMESNPVTISAKCVTRGSQARARLLSLVYTVKNGSLL